MTNEEKQKKTAMIIMNQWKREEGNREKHKKIYAF